MILAARAFEETQIMRSRTRWIVTGCLALAALASQGCAGMPFPPTYTIEEMAARCIRDGGVWRGFVGYEGYCEHQSAGFM